MTLPRFPARELCPILGVLLLWAGTGMLAFGLHLAYLQHAFPKRDCAENRRDALFLIPGGPVAVASILFSATQPGSDLLHGVRWRCPL